MALVLSKVAETSTTITLGWTPPPGADHYVFYAKGAKVSAAPAVDRNGNVKASIKYAKGNAPYEVGCLTRVAGVFAATSGIYPTSVGAAAYPSTQLFPSEVAP